jgi:hypothetical protein
MHVRTALLASALAVFLGVVWAPAPALACIGGTPFRNAIEVTRGGILEGRITHAVDTMGRGIEVELADVRRISGRPDLITDAVLMAGMTCDQSIDVGETVWLLYEVGDLEILPTLTIAYVVEGPDAVSDAERRRALGVLPDTSTEPSSRPRGGGSPSLLVALWLLAFVMVVWRLPLRRRPPLL